MNANNVVTIDHEPLTAAALRTMAGVALRSADEYRREGREREAAIREADAQFYMRLARDIIAEADAAEIGGAS